MGVCGTTNTPDDIILEEAASEDSRVMTSNDGPTILHNKDIMDKTRMGFLIYRNDLDILLTSGYFSATKLNYKRRTLLLKI